MIKNTIKIHASDLLVKRKELVSEIRAEEIKKAESDDRIKIYQGELEHIDYVLKNFSQNINFPPEELPLDSLESDLSIKEVMLQVLKQAGRPVRKKDFFNMVKSKVKCSMNTFSSYLGELSKTGEIKRAEKGVYQYVN